MSFIIIIIIILIGYLKNMVDKNFPQIQHRHLLHVLSARSLSPMIHMYPSVEDLLFHLRNNYDVMLLVIAVFSITITYLLSTPRRRIHIRNGESDAAAPGGSGSRDIPGRLGVPFIGETFSFLKATNSTKGCYDFVRLRRSWSVDPLLFLSKYI